MFATLEVGHFFLLPYLNNICSGCSLGMILLLPDILDLSFQTLWQKYNEKSQEKKTIKIKEFLCKSCIYKCIADYGIMNMQKNGCKFIYASAEGRRNLLKRLFHSMN